MDEMKTVDMALQMASDAGARQARIILEKDVENSATVINDKVDKLLSSSGSTMFIQLFIDGRYGSFSTNMLRSDELRKFISSAAEATRLIAPDDCRSLPESEICFHGKGPDLAQYDGRIKDITTSDRIEMAMASASEIWGSDPRLLSVETEWGDDTEYTCIADSQGFHGETLVSNHTINATVSIKGKGDEKPESWWYESGIRREDAPVKGCSSKALQRAVDQLNARKIRSGRYNVVIDGTISSKVVSPLVKALSGGYLQQENSFLNASLGKKPFGDSLTICDMPHIKGLPGSRLFDDEGVATKERTIIGGGYVENWFISTYYSKKMGIPTTISSPSVLRFGQNQKKDITLPQLLNETGKGILITDFNGGNCNTATGDFSYGVRGFLFENGRMVHPISEMNITGNMIRLWNNLIEAGTDYRTASRWGLPSLAFGSVDFSGI